VPVRDGGGRLGCYRGNETSVEEVTAIQILEPSHRTGPDTNPVRSANTVYY